MKGKLALFGGAKTVTASYPSYPVMGKEEMANVIGEMLKGHLSECGRAGSIGEMEEAYARRFGTRYALSFSSGTSAIHGALFAVGVKPGDEVLTANNTWISAITAVCHAGGTPVFCDIKRGAFHIDPAEIRRKAGPHTRAVIVTHLWGIPADMDPILKVSREKGLAVIEDCSHAHGGIYKGRLLGTIGDVGCFSLQASKAIVAGEGGFILTNNKRYYQRAMVPGHHGVRMGQELTYKDLRPFALAGGYWKYRASPLEMAIALAQLSKLDQFNAARQANFERLQKRLKRTVPFIKWPKLPPRSGRGWYGTPAFYAYDRNKVSRDLFVRACNAEGASVGCGYANWYQLPLFQDLRLYGQLWPVEHVNGVRYKPLPAGALKNDEALRTKLLVFSIPAVEMPALMDQVAEAVEKVAAAMPELARYQKRERKR
jgi:perosamine synthetase